MSEFMSEMNLASSFNASLHSSQSASSNSLQAPKTNPLDKVLSPIKNWLDGLEIQDRDTAHLLCRLIPAQCPFERDIVMFGRKVAHIPPMCKLNPLYEQFVGLRFRSLCYLVDVCGEML